MKERLSDSSLKLRITKRLITLSAGEGVGNSTSSRRLPTGWQWVRLYLKGNLVVCKTVIICQLCNSVFRYLS